MVFPHSTAPTCFKRANAPACRNCSAARRARPKRFGERMPAKLILRSAMRPPTFRESNARPAFRLARPSRWKQHPARGCSLPRRNAPANSFRNFAFTWMNPFFGFLVSTGKRARVSVVRWPPSPLGPQRRRNPDPATGLRRRTSRDNPLALNSFASTRANSPLHFPHGPRTAFVKKQKLTPSRLMKSYSWAYAVISFFRCADRPS